jgi:ribosome-associated protein
MVERSTLELAPGREIPVADLTLVTGPSSGPGGQNVNKVETRVTVLFDVAAAPQLSPEEKARLRARLASRLSKAGVLRVTSQKHRSQADNRDAALERLETLLREALVEERPRKATRIPAAARRRRLEAKRQKSAVKRGRRRVDEGG